MKKTTRLLILFTLHFLIFSTFNKNVHSSDSLESFGDQEIEILASSMKENCQTKQFFLNIKKNKQYPKFGSIKEWREFCVKLEDTKVNVKNLITKNIRIFKNNYPAGLITGYYQPTIKVSFIRNKEYKHPILKKNKIYNLKTRAFIDKNYKDDDIILWTDDYINLFFLQIQGSGIGVFEDGKKVKIGYEGNNNLPYKSIGKVLIQQNKINPEEVDLFTIKFWLRDNESEAYSIMKQNRRYIFFKIKESNTSLNPRGALGLELKPNFSIAIDKDIYPIGIPFIIEYLKNGKRKLAISHDTGSAIKGYNRADLFTGNSSDSEKIAGRLKKQIYLYALIPYSN